MLGQIAARLKAQAGLRPLAWATVLGALALGLCAVPLFNLLGYDFSFAIGLVASLAAVDLGHGVVARARRAGQPISLWRLMARAVALALAVLALPLLLSLGNALRVRNCNLASGLAFYALLPVASAAFAAPVGLLAGLALPGRRGRVFAWLAPVLSLSWALARLYFDPPVFAFDPFGGYFPGPIYDEALRPPARLAHFRLANLVWISAAVAVAAALTGGGRPGPQGVPAPAWRRPPLRWAAAAFVLLAVGAVLYFERAALRFHLRADDLAAVLARRTESAHFVVHSDPLAGDRAADLDLVHRDLEFRYAQLARILGAEPRGRVVVYRFPSAAAKKDLVGAGGTLYAKPWTREIFVQAERFPAPRLRHELAHAFAAAFGDRLFGVSLAWRLLGPLPVPRLATGLVEGVAEAADFGDPDGRSTLHQEARAMIDAGHAAPLRAVVGAGFTALSGARAYTLAGSFCRFLLDTRGAERLRALYRSAGDFAGTYGAPLDDLERAWRAFLDRQPLDADARATAAERFRRPAIFRKVCARELAARVAEARDRVHADPARAIRLLESVCADDPGEPIFRLDLADAHHAAASWGRALDIAAAVESDPGVTRPLRARAAGLATAVHFHAGRFAEAEGAARRFVAAVSEDGDRRLALARLRALRDPDARRTLGRVLFGDTPGRGLDPGLALHLVETFARAAPNEALGPYLLGRQLEWRDPRLALAPLEDACGARAAARAVALEPVFRKECLRLLGEVALRTDALDRSRAAFELLGAEATLEADRLRAADFLERVAWTLSGSSSR